MSLQNPLGSVSSFGELLSLCQGATSEVSFWGSRQVRIPEVKGLLSIDSLITRVEQLLEANFEFCERERSAGQQIIDFITRIYNDGDQQLQKMSMLALFLDKARAFIPSEQRLRASWEEDDTKTAFEYYTKAQYCSTFGAVPQGHCHLTITGCPDRWRAPSATASTRS